MVVHFSVSRLQAGSQGAVHFPAGVEKWLALKSFPSGVRVRKTKVEKSRRWINVTPPEQLVQWDEETKTPGKRKEHVKGETKISFILLKELDYFNLASF